MELTLLRSTLPTTLIILLLFSAARRSAARHRAIDRPGFAAPQQARDAVSASLGAARGALALVARSSGDGPRAPAPPEAAALGDCAVALGDAVAQLQRSLDALGKLPRARPWAEVDDAETWVSAALTDENMCAQGFAAVEGEGEVKSAVARGVADAAERTSNALALINGLRTTAP
ncbi:21 kDa protein-like [Ananas comosus]|uniref:21 kDa protein-like n=1 Tax=Ananas comosus TaxID=4615 RepID=A0A6P5FCU1_ANACO|nr:21 kDa protein-like [Ananas comosus]